MQLLAGQHSQAELLLNGYIPFILLMPIMVMRLEVVEQYLKLPMQVLAGQHSQVEHLMVYLPFILLMSILVMR